MNLPPTKPLPLESVCSRCIDLAPARAPATPAKIFTIVILNSPKIWLLLNSPSRRQTLLAAEVSVDNHRAGGKAPLCIARGRGSIHFIFSHCYNLRLAAVEIYKLSTTKPRRLSHPPVVSYFIYRRRRKTKREAAGGRRQKAHWTLR